MPYSMTVQGSGLIRTNGLVKGDYTALIRYNFTGLPGVGLYRTVMGQLIDAVLVGNIPTTYAGNAAIYSQQNSNNYNLDIFNGIDVITSNAALLANTQYNLAYIRKGSNHYFYSVQALGAPTLIGSVTLDISTTNINALVIGNDGGAAGVGDPTNLTVAYFRDYSAALTLNEIFNESNSSRALRTLNLVSDCPFETNLLDKSGNANHFQDQSTAGTFTTSVPVPNYTIAALPFSQVVPQATFNALNLIWVKYTNDVGKAFGFYTNSGGTFTPKMQLYLADGISLAHQVATSLGAYRIIGPGDYYLKIIRNAGGASNFDFTTQADFKPIDANIFNIPRESILVNDDTGGLSATLMKTDGTVQGFLTIIPAGEVGAAAPNGITVWHNPFNYDTRIREISRSFALITDTNTIPGLTNTLEITSMCHNLTNFYILNKTDGKVWKLTDAGVLTNTGVTIISPENISAIGVNLAATVLYYTEGYTSTTIKKWDMVNNVSLGTFYAIPELVSGDVGWVAQSSFTDHDGEILVLSNDHVVTWYQNDTKAKNVIIELSPTGVLLTSATFTGNYQYVDHIALLSGSTTIRVWFFKDNLEDSGSFATLAFATGTLITSFITDLFSGNKNTNSRTGGSAMFGPSSSCRMVSYLFLNQGGIYKMVQNKRNDTLWLDVGAGTKLDVKIPDPLGETAAIGN